nr:hypothetical protein [Hepelivirales sp.]
MNPVLACYCPYPHTTMEDGTEKCPCYLCSGILFNMTCHPVDDAQYAAFEEVCRHVGVGDDVCDCYFNDDTCQEYLDTMLIGSFDEPSNGYYVLERNKSMNLRAFPVSTTHNTTVFTNFSQGAPILPEHALRLPLINECINRHDTSLMHIIPIMNDLNGDIAALSTLIHDDEAELMAEALHEAMNVESGNESGSELASD